MKKESKIYIAGHTGLVGSAILRKLKSQGYKNLVLKTRSEFNLMNEHSVNNFFKKEKPEYVFFAAAKVGGIIANSSKPAEFIYENLQIQNNIIHNAYLSKVKKLIFLGSSCIYPRLSKQPIKEEYLLSGKLEETNESYAIAKITGIKMCQAYNKQYGTNFISAMPTNLYGPNDNFNPELSHVIPGLIKKFHDAKINKLKEVTLWGSGKPKREFLYVDDLAEALIFLMNDYDKSEIINVGSGKEISIKELAFLIKKITNYEGKILWDKSKPDGTPRKLLDVKKINKLGWKTKVELEEGLKKTYRWFENIVDKANK